MIEFIVKLSFGGLLNTFIQITLEMNFTDKVANPQQILFQLTDVIKKPVLISIGIGKFIK